MLAFLKQYWQLFAAVAGFLTATGGWVYSMEARAGQHEVDINKLAEAAKANAASVAKAHERLDAEKAAEQARWNTLHEQCVLGSLKDEQLCSLAKLRAGH